MTLYATCQRCEAIKEVGTVEEQQGWTCRAHSRKRRPVARQCAGCPATFTPNRPEQRFCSRACGTKESVRRYFTPENRRRGGMNSAAKKRAMMPADLAGSELDAYRRGYKRGYLLGYNAQRRERAKQEAA